MQKLTTAQDSDLIESKIAQDILKGAHLDVLIDTIWRYKSRKNIIRHFMVQDIKSMYIVLLWLESNGYTSSVHSYTFENLIRAKRLTQVLDKSEIGLLCLQAF